MRHLKELLHRRGGKPPPTSEESSGETGGSETPKTEGKMKDETPSPPPPSEKKVKHKHKKSGKVEEDEPNGEKDGQHKRKHSKRARSNEHRSKAERASDSSVLKVSQIRVCAPQNTSGNHSRGASSESDKEPLQKRSTSASSGEADPDFLAAAGLRMPTLTTEPPFTAMSRGRQRSDAFYDVSLPVIGNGGVNFGVNDLPQPAQSFRVKTGSACLPEGVSWSLRFTIGVADTIGRRTSMEDTFAVVGQFGMPMRDLFLVCDGHNGSEASHAVSKMLPGAIQEHLNNGKCSIEEALKAAFAEVNGRLDSEKIPGGTTATAVLADINATYVASVGDSRAVLIKRTKATALTTDHRPCNSEEASAVIARGGTITTTGNEQRVNNILAITRALGDPELAGVISAVPDVRSFVFDFEPDSAIVIACDGLWDYLSEQDVADVVDTFKEPLSAAEELRNLAYQSGSTDNITVIVIRAAS